MVLTMNSQLQLIAICSELSAQHRVQVSLHGWNLLLEFSQDKGLSISTLIYQGDQYTPPGVRQGLQGNPFEGMFHLRTHLTLDEESHTVTLHYRGGVEDLSERALAPLLDEFSWTAEQWWRYLDDRDKRDLVYIMAR